MFRITFLLGVAISAVLPALAIARQPAERDLFAVWDHDGDGKLTRGELPERLRSNFDRVDRDRDGFITRAEHRAFADRRRQPKRRQSSIPEGVEIRRDIDYVGDANPRHTLDLLVPKDRKEGGRLPVVVFIHGGGWRNGDKASGLGRVAPLVASGKFAGATINYRLTDEAHWPAQIHDCKAAIRFLRGRADEFGIDPKKIAVWGGSAGGHLVSLLGTSGGVKKLEGALGDHDKQSSRVSCVVNFFGPQDFLTMIRQPSVIDRAKGDRYPEALLLGGPVPERKKIARQASPVNWVSDDDPPFLTAHGTEDKVVPFQQAEEIHAALRKAGVESHLIRMVGAGHGFRSPEIDRRVRAFLDKHLRGKDVEVSDEPIGTR